MNSSQFLDNFMDNKLCDWHKLLLQYSKGAQLVIDLFE